MTTDAGMPGSRASQKHPPSFDVLIAGGGIVGSAVAYFLSAGDPSRGKDSGPGTLRIAVVERDPTYARSSTALSVGGVRQQFSTLENIQLSLFSAEFLREARSILAVEDLGPEVEFREAGYLFLATEEGLPTLRRNHARQTGAGAEVEILRREDLHARFPWLQTSDLAAGSLGLRGEGWIDPYGLLLGFKKKAQSQGVLFLQDEVVGVTPDHGSLERVRLRDGGEVAVGVVVNATGPRAARFASLAGIPDLPIRPRKRFVYGIRTPGKLPCCPLVVDPSGVYFRPEGDGFLCGVSPPPDRDPDTLDLEMDYELFHQEVWPVLARRVPAFDSLRLGSSWAGHYAYNTMDQNAVLGPHPERRNFLFANGFSGHGLQHSPGIGRALSELILFGEYRTLDLSCFGFSRFGSGALIREENVV